MKTVNWMQTYRHNIVSGTALGIAIYLAIIFFLTQDNNAVICDGVHLFRQLYPVFAGMTSIPVLCFLIITVGLYSKTLRRIAILAPKDNIINVRNVNSNVLFENRTAPNHRPKSGVPSTSSQLGSMDTRDLEDSDILTCDKNNEIIYNCQIQRNLSTEDVQKLHLHLTDISIIQKKKKDVEKEVRNAQGAVDSNQVKPEFVKSPLNTTVTMGQSVAMDCEVRGHPTPTVSWLFNVRFNNMSTIVSSDNHGIHVAIVTWRHVGLYTCVASNILEAATRDGRLSVHVLPRIQAINGDPVVYLNHELDLTCTVSGIPNPTIKWFHQDIAVVPSLDGRVTIPAQNKLFIKYVKVSDKGEYKCVAENLAGKTEFPITVTIIESPIPPVLTRAVSFTSTSVTLTWSPSTQKSNTPLSQIDVDYKRLPITAGSTDVQIEVVGLSPGTMYMFVVSGVNPAGEGSLSNVLSAKTMDSGPSAPRNLKILFSNSSTVQLEWEIPAKTNGQIRKYQVWYKIKGGNTEIMSLVTTKDISKPSVTLTISNVDPFTLYEFKVRGATEESGEDMWGELSGYIDVKTSASVPSDVPQITKKYRHYHLLLFK
ncbi:NEO1 [Mytilus edulis]|uniref:NEO1 n=1 Tax=Mytilus edulis TaxID=6550 RepID=A0A8S3RCY5_MYTED|nr:NEO1 [Mytilus edulis]